jgi:hypothetical protein
MTATGRGKPGAKASDCGAADSWFGHRCWYGDASLRVGDDDGGAAAGSVDDSVGVSTHFTYKMKYDSVEFKTQVGTITLDLFMPIFWQSFLTSLFILLVLTWKRIGRASALQPLRMFCSFRWVFSTATHFNLYSFGP